MSASKMNHRHEGCNVEDDDPNISTAPLVEQRAFGRGLWKNPINFVPAGSVPKVSATARDGRSIAEMYRAIVFPNGIPPPQVENFPLCGICGAPLKEPDYREHYLTSTHQAALPRAPTPSAIDRTRMGLKYLQKHGYKVDARKGLGANGDGILFPLIVKRKRDNLGLGIEQKEHDKKKASSGASVTPVKKVNLDAGKVRKLAEADAKKHRELERMFYGNGDEEKYLGYSNGCDGEGGPLTSLRCV